MATMCSIFVFRIDYSYPKEKSLYYLDLSPVAFKKNVTLNISKKQFSEMVNAFGLKEHTDPRMKGHYYIPEPDSGPVSKLK